MNYRVRVIYIKSPYQNMTIVERVQARAGHSGITFVPVPNYRETPPWPLIGMADSAAKVAVGRVYYADSSGWVGNVS